MLLQTTEIGWMFHPLRLGFDSWLGKPKTIKIGIYSFPVRRSTSKGQCAASTVCGRQMGWWQLDLKTDKSLCCLLAEVTWPIKCNYNRSFSNFTQMQHYQFLT